jgi:hypothetical protein
MNFEVLAVEGSKQFQSKFGPMVSYSMNVVGTDGFEVSVEMNQKAETPAPHVGQVIYGHIEETEYGMKLKKDQTPEPTIGGPNEHAFARSKASSAPQQTSFVAPKSEETQAMIIRQSSSDRATALAIRRSEILEAQGKIEEALDALKPTKVLLSAVWIAKYCSGTWTPDMPTKAKLTEPQPEDYEEPLPEEPKRAFDEYVED